MQTSGFFDANQTGNTYDRIYYVDDFARYFASFVGNGVFAKQEGKLQVKASTHPAMTVEIQTGAAWINGYWYRVDGDPIVLPVQVADGINPRIDSVVVRWSKADRKCSVEVKKGTPSVNPSPQSLTRGPDVYELQLATIKVAGGATVIRQADITDTRPDNAVCGWVVGIVDQIDTTGLFDQFTDAFETWFEAVKDSIPPEVTMPIMVSEVQKIWDGGE